MRLKNRGRNAVRVSRLAACSLKTPSLKSPASVESLSPSLHCFLSLPLVSPSLLCQCSRLITLTGEQHSVWLLPSQKLGKAHGHKHMQNSYILHVFLFSSLHVSGQQDMNKHGKMLPLKSAHSVLHDLNVCLHLVGLHVLVF